MGRADRPAERGREHGPRGLCVAAAGHPDDGAGRRIGTNLSNSPSSERRRDGAHLGTCHRRCSQQTHSIGVQQAFGIVEVDDAGRNTSGVHVNSFAPAATWAGDLVDDLLDRLGGAGLDVEPQQRFGVGHPQVEPAAVTEVHGHPVEVVDRVHAGAERLAARPPRCPGRR